MTRTATSPQSGSASGSPARGSTQRRSWGIATRLAGDLSAEVAGLAHHDLLGLRVELFAYEAFGPRVWELRENLTAYDAWYVALAEHLRSPVATLDERLSRATGPRCPFTLPI